MMMKLFAAAVYICVFGGGGGTVENGAKNGLGFSRKDDPHNHRGSPENSTNH